MITYKKQRLNVASKKTMVLLIMVFIGSFGYSQTAFGNKNTVHLELGGHGFGYSLNYERVLINKPIFKTTLSAGFAYYPPSVGMRDFWLPILANQIYSFNNRHHIELGVGYTLIYEQGFRGPTTNDTAWQWGGAYAARLGYRYVSNNDKIVVRAGFTPFAERYGENLEFHPHAGASIGFAF